MISPLVGLIVAIVGLDDVQLPPATVDVNVVVCVAQIDWLPLKIPGFGAADTVTVLVVDALGQPPAPLTV